MFVSMENVYSVDDFIKLGYNEEEAWELNRIKDWLYSDSKVQLKGKDEKEYIVSDIDWKNRLVQFENTDMIVSFEQVVPSEKEVSIGIFEGGTYKVITDEFVAYGFETSEGVWVEEAWGDMYYFIISKRHDSDIISVNVGYSEDYSYMEDVTYRFKVDEWWAFFEHQKETIENHTQEYLEWVEEEFGE
jgi:hypothetical protein